MSEQKPREWWINFAYVVPDVTDEHPHKSQFARRNFDNSKVVHVIEKSAYDSLKAENERLKELVGQADQIILLTHPELSKAEMNTLTTMQYVIWKKAKDK